MIVKEKKQEKNFLYFLFNFDVLGFFLAARLVRMS